MATPHGEYRYPINAPTSAIWQEWTSSTTNTTSATNDGSGTIWMEWTTGTSSTSSSITCSPVASNVVWYTWNTEDGLRAVPTPAITRSSPEELAYYVEAARVQAAAEVERQKKAQAERVAAQKRAEKLLLSNLSRQQKRDWLNAQFFMVRAKSGRTFKVTNRPHVNVIEIDGAGNSIVAWCAGPEGGVPVQDQFLAQKLMLECNEDAFFQVANRHTIEHSNVLQ